MAIIHWFRRDLRLHDNTALWHACRDTHNGDAGGGVIPVFIFDDAILRHSDCGAPIVRFMLDCLTDLRTNIRSEGGDLIFLHGKPLERLQILARQTKSKAIYYNKDYAPGAVERDEEIERVLAADGIELKGFKDQVIFEEQEILTISGGEPYTIYTPYKNAWLNRLQKTEFQVLPKPKFNFPPLLKEVKGIAMPTAADLGFTSAHQIEIKAGETGGRTRLEEFCREKINGYKNNRDIPALDGTSRLSPHLRHGTISPRQCVEAALQVCGQVKMGDGRNSDGPDCWIGELIWRDFYQQVLFNFPHVEHEPFKQNLKWLKWRKSQADWTRWTSGQTGFPIVDAAMRQLNQTGWMHNRLRMIVAMFLTKDLLIDYRLGERYFMQNLIDGETAQNNGGWQWSASTGTDAQPYFRIFNPTSQSEKFDPSGVFIRKYCPELSEVPLRYIHSPQQMTDAEQRDSHCRIGVDYPAPMVDHAVARERAIQTFKEARE